MIQRRTLLQSGAAVALLVLRAALERHNAMATFAEAGIV